MSAVVFFEICLYAIAVNCNSDKSRRTYFAYHSCCFGVYNSVIAAGIKTDFLNTILKQYLYSIHLRGLCAQVGYWAAGRIAANGKNKYPDSNNADEVMLKHPVCKYLFQGSLLYFSKFQSETVQQLSYFRKTCSTEILDAHKLGFRFGNQVADGFNV